MSDGVDLVHHVQNLALELARIPELGEVYRRAVSGLLDPLGFDRAALFLYDEFTLEMQGTWGTNDNGKVVDESAYKSSIGSDHAFLTEALAEPDRIRVWENRELKLWDKVVGTGWNAMVVLQDGDRTLGWLSVDNAFSQLPLTPMQREVLSLYGRTLSSTIQHKQFQVLTQKYRTQNDLKDRLFTILAHDLRGPIGNIGVMLDLALDTTVTHEDSREILIESREAAFRTYNLLDNVLGWVRSQISEVSALRQRIPLKRPLTSVQAWLSSTAKGKNITLEVDCPETLSGVTDERMVETIVRNLVSNAIKYSPVGSKVLLRGRGAGEWMILEVVDQGTGIGADKVKVLFTNNQKVSQPGTTGESGNGLGLMFSSDLAHTLGGHLEAESVPGQGSTFRLVLPDVLDGEL